MPDRPSHAGIFGYGPEDEMIAQLIADSIVESRPAG
jgi:hypothetical protein